ncbi:MULTISPECIES: hypothetical protein [unclassified Mesorhizobium]|uniref:hypothetical protein n=1 Tax=unclassified Mesorhizobium TaxID=325217 RepID=UPI0033353C69
MEKVVNDRFPPVSPEQHRTEAISTAMSALAGMKDPNIAVGLSISDAAKIINSSELKSRFGIVNVTLRGDQQILFADVSLDKQFSDVDFPALDNDTRTTLNSWRPHFKGTITFGLGVTSASAQSENGNLNLSFHLLPLFKNIHVDKIDLAEKIDLTAAADMLIPLLNDYADNISGELSRADFAKVSFPAIPIDRMDPSRSISLDGPEEAAAKITISGNPISSPVYIRSVVWLIDADSFAAIAELAAVGSEPVAAADGAAGAVDFSRLDVEFTQRLSAGLSLPEAIKGEWIAVSKSLVADVVNAVVTQADLCIGASASIPDQSFSNKIEIPDETSIDCTPKMDCTPTKDCTPTADCTQTQDCSQTRDCSQPHDERNCHACLLRAPRVCFFGSCSGGQCIKEGNDPFCEAQKAAQNDAYAGSRLKCEAEKAAARGECEAAKSGRKFDCEKNKAASKVQCEGQKEAARLACEAEKTGKKALCETAKEGLKRISRLGNVANVDGKVGGSGTLSVCIKKLSLSHSLDNLSASLSVSGQASADFGIKYVPLDIAGYLVCQVPWTENKHLDVRLPTQELGLSSQISLDMTTTPPKLKAVFKTSALAVKMRPGPRDLILQSYNMRLSCLPVNGLLDPVVVEASRAIPELNGDFELAGQERAFELVLTPTTFEIEGTSMSATTSYQATEKALVVGGALSPTSP